MVHPSLLSKFEAHKTATLHSKKRSAANASPSTSEPQDGPDTKRPKLVQPTLLKLNTGSSSVSQTRVDDLISDYI